jgi:hypothetical protein
MRKSLATNTNCCTSSSEYIGIVGASAVDEAHLINQGTQTKLVISALSATQRHSVTGTPIGAQLSNLNGQLRLLRLAPFWRPTL